MERESLRLVKRLSRQAVCHVWIPPADSICLPLYILEGDRHLRQDGKEWGVLCPLIFGRVPNLSPFCGKALLMSSDKLFLDPCKE